MSEEHEPVDIGRRLRAARILGGYDNPQALADAIGERGFGVGPMRAIERGVRAMEPSEQAVVAAACGLPVSFFTAPLERLGDELGAGGRSADVPGDRETAEALGRLADQVADLRDDLVRSDVIVPRGRAATQVATAAARRRTAPRSPEDEARTHRQGPGRG